MGLITWVPSTGDGLTWPAYTTIRKHLSAGVVSDFFSSSIPCLFDVEMSSYLNQIVAEIRRQGEEIYLWENRGQWWSPTAIPLLPYFVNDDLDENGQITFDQLGRMQQYVDYIRIVKGLGAFAWTNDYNDTPPDTRIRINRTDMTELRTALVTDHLWAHTYGMDGDARRVLSSADCDAWGFNTGFSFGILDLALLGDVQAAGGLNQGSRAIVVNRTIGDHNFCFGPAARVPPCTAVMGTPPTIDVFNPIKRRRLRAYRLPANMPAIESVEATIVLVRNSALGDRYRDGCPSGSACFGACPQLGATVLAPGPSVDLNIYHNTENYTLAQLEAFDWYGELNLIDTVDPATDAIDFGGGPDPFEFHATERTSWPVPPKGARRYNLIFASADDDLDIAPADVGDFFIGGNTSTNCFGGGVCNPSVQRSVGGTILAPNVDLVIGGASSSLAVIGGDDWLTRAADTFMKLFPRTDWSSSSGCSSLSL